MAVKAAANDLKKVALELGGKSPNIILEDADLATAIPGAANAIFLTREEIFGPAVTASPFKDADEDLLRRANDTSYGPAAGVCTRDIGKAHRIANRLRAGTVWINCYNIFCDALPFGGHK